MKRFFGGTVTKAVALSMTVCVAGCASIVSKSNWPVTIQSNPGGAKCVVAKENGVSIHTGETPMTLTLESGDGFFQRAKYSIKCDKPGYQTATLDTSASFNGWYLGNIVFGGLIGILIVDPATGAMYRLDETQVVNLLPDTAEGRAQNSENLTQQGLKHFNDGEFETAIRYLDKALAITPNHAKAQCYKGMCFSKLGKYDAALENLDKAISANASLPEPYKQRGDVFALQGKPEKAEGDFTKAISINPAYNDALFSRGTLYIKENKIELGKADLKLACKQGYDRACNYQF